jgi:monothiol glutaredoxin
MRKVLDEQKIESRAAHVISGFHGDIVSEVEQAIQKHEWVLVGMAQNPFPKKARKLFQDKGIAFHEMAYGSYFSKWSERLALKIWSGWPTFPMIFHKGVLVGGYTDLEKYLASK